MIQLAIIRHGYTSWNHAGRIQGHTDVPLSSDAIEELQQHQLPTEWEKAAIVSSPLSRAKITAELICGSMPQLQEALIEMNWGDWEGRRTVEIGVDPRNGYRHIENWGWDFRPPGGETPAEVRARLMPWLSSLKQNTLAVCHIGVMRVLLAMAYGWQFRGSAPFAIKRNRLYIINVAENLSVAEPAVIRLIKRSNALR